MEEKEKLTLKEEEKFREKKGTAIATLEPETEKQDKAKVNLQTLRAELAKEKEQKRAMLKKEKAVIERPNYDFIKEIPPEKRKKIYKIEKTIPETNSKPFTFSKRLKAIIFSLIFLVGGAFCLTSGINLINTSNALNAAHSTYEISISKLIKKISKISR